MKRRLLTALLPLALAACGETVDKSAAAAKARIFSPEDPPIEAIRAKDKLDLGALGDDPKLVRRILAMERLETVRRLGGHKALTTVKFTWKRDDRKVELVEKYDLTVDAEGRFHATTTNSEDGGLEVLFTDGRAYARGRYGPYRPRRLDRAHEDVWRNRAAPAGPVLLSLLGRQLKLTGGDAVDQDGRAGRRYRLELGKLPEADAEDDLPPIQFGQFRDAITGQNAPGPDPDTARRLAFEKDRRAESLKGTCVVDKATAVLLALNATAQFSVPSPDGKGDAKLLLELQYSAFAKPNAKIAPPREDEVEALKLPHVEKDPLSFLGAKPEKAAAPSEPGEDADDATAPIE